MDHDSASGEPGTSSSRKRRVQKDEDDDEDEPTTKILIEEKTFNLESFCDEILIEIFKNLDSNTLIALGKTCIRFYVLIADRRLWKNIDLTSEALTIREIQRRLNFKNYETRSIKIRGLTDLYPRESWNNSTISDNLLKKITEMCPFLETLEIHEGFMNLETIAISDFPNTVTKLVFNKCYVKFPKTPNTFFTRIDMYFSLLEELILENCNWFETHDLVTFSKIPKLKKLSLKGCDNLKECVPYCSLATRFGFKSLEYLDVRDTPICDSDVQCFNITLTLKVLLLECPEDLRTARPADHRERRTRGQRLEPPSPNNSIDNDDEQQEIHIVVNENRFITQRLNDNNNRPPVQVFVVNPEINSLNNDDNQQPERSQQQPPPSPIRLLPPDINRDIARSLWFQRRYPPPFAPPRIFPISDRGICSFGSPRNQVQLGVIWIRAEMRPPDINLEKLVIKYYTLVTDVSLNHLVQCTPNLKYLDLTGTSVTKSGVENFKKQKPECFIISDHFTG